MNATIKRDTSGTMWTYIGSSSNIINLDALRLIMSPDDHADVCRLLPGESMPVMIMAKIIRREDMELVERGHDAK